MYRTNVTERGRVVRSLLALRTLTIGLTALAALPAFADTNFAFSVKGTAYDSGVLPSVAISGQTVIEVHQGGANGFGPLWSRTGKIQADGTVIFARDAIQYDTGGRPSVAISGTNVIEVHEGSANGFGPLWYKTGRIQADGSVLWSHTAYQYDNGGRPSVAISGNDIIEVHQGSANPYGPLWFKTGHMQFDVDGKVNWNSSAFPYDNGGAPRVAMSGPNIIVVHQGSSSLYGPLWYKTGQFQADSQVKWASTANFYDMGASPSVALQGATIVEVHAGSADASGALWFHAGQIQSSGVVVWDPAGTQYDTGGTPAVALSGAVGLAVHQAGVGFGLEMYRAFLF